MEDSSKNITPSDFRAPNPRIKLPDTGKNQFRGGNLNERGKRALESADGMAPEAKAKPRAKRPRQKNIQPSDSTMKLQCTHTSLGESCTNCVKTENVCVPATTKGREATLAMQITKLREELENRLKAIATCLEENQDQKQIKALVELLMESQEQKSDLAKKLAESQEQNRDLATKLAESQEQNRDLATKLAESQEQKRNMEIKWAESPRKKEFQGETFRTPYADIISPEAIVDPESFSMEATPVKLKTQFDHGTLMPNQLGNEYDSSFTGKSYPFEEDWLTMGFE